MNKRQNIINVANELLEKNGTTTTLEIKDALRNRFPKERWVQHYVSNTMREEFNNGNLSGVTFRDNGRNRVYQKSVNTPSTNKGKTYTFKMDLEQGNTVVSSVISSDSPENVVKTAASVGVNVRWSKSKQEFVLIENMHPAHMANALRKDIANTTSVDDLGDVFTSPLMEYFINSLKNDLTDED